MKRGSERGGGDKEGEREPKIDIEFSITALPLTPLGETEGKVELGRENQASLRRTADSRINLAF